jgi:hypothetical protein
LKRYDSVLRPTTESALATVRSITGPRVVRTQTVLRVLAAVNASSALEAASSLSAPPHPERHTATAAASAAARGVKDFSKIEDVGVLPSVEMLTQT